MDFEQYCHTWEDLSQKYGNCEAVPLSAVLEKLKSFEKNYIEQNRKNDDFGLKNSSENKLFCGATSTTQRETSWIALRSRGELVEAIEQFLAHFFYRFHREQCEYSTLLQGKL